MMEHTHMTLVLAHFALCILLGVARSVALPTNATNALSERGYASGDGLLAPLCNCGVTNGSLVDERCDGGTVSVTHTDAFGGSNEAIQTCLSELTEKNKRVCYRTMLTMCSDTPSLQCLLKKRNPNNDNIIKRQCSNIANYSMLDELKIMNERMYIHSPRYECQKSGSSKTGVHKYRHNELCLYDVSMTCESGKVTLRSENPSLQPAADPGNSQTCVDYVEVRHSHGNERFCGSESWQSLGEISSNFTVLFWSADAGEGPQAGNKFTGFELVAECTRSTSTSTPLLD